MSQFEFNPLTGKFDIVGSAGGAVLPVSTKVDYHLSSLAAYDRIASVTYADEGLRTQRISSITYSSVLFPDADLVATVDYLDVGSMSQRINKIEFAGSVFLPDSLRKVFTYSTSGVAKKPASFYYELF